MTANAKKDLACDAYLNMSFSIMSLEESYKPTSSDPVQHFELLPDINGDGIPEKTVTVPSSFSWEGTECLTLVNKADIFTTAQKNQIRHAMATGQTSIALMNTWVVRLSIPNNGDAAILANRLAPRIVYVPGRFDPYRLPVLPASPEYLAITPSAPLLDVAAEQKVVKGEKPPEVIAFEHKAGKITIGSVITIDLDKAGLDATDGNTFRVINVVPGPIENGRIVAEASALVLVATNITELTPKTHVRRIRATLESITSVRTPK